MLTHEQLYRKIGLHKLDHYIKPRLLTDTDFIFPVRSELNWFKISAVVDTPTLNLGYLRNVDKHNKPVVISRYIYNNPIGSFKTVENNIIETIREQQKQNPGMIFVKPKAKMIKIAKEKIIINNYGTMSAVHTYRQLPTTTYDRWYNGLNALINNLNTADDENRRQKYILVEIPSNIPNKEAFDKTFKQNLRQVLETFPTSKHLTLLELWKFLTPTRAKDSLFFKIKRSELQNITLMFVYNNKLTLLNLNTLVASVKEYEGKTSIQEQPANVIRKMFLIYLMKIKLEVAKSQAELDSEDSTLDLTGVTHIDDSKIEDKEVTYILDDELDDMIDDVDYDGITDEMLTNNKANDIVDEVENDPTDIVYNIDSVKNKLDKRIYALRDNNVLSKKEAEDLKNTLDMQDKLLDPYRESRDTLKDILTYKDEDFVIDEKDKVIPDINVIQDKAILQDTIGANNKHYLDKLYRKDIINTIYGLQNADVIINNHEVEISEDILGGVETHMIEVKPLTGKPSKLVFRLPLIKEDGTFKISNHRYVIRKQRGVYPISKINSDEVALSSYYGKSFITRSDFKKDQIGYWFRRKLIEASSTNEKISNLVFMPVKLMDVKTPKLYSDIANYTKMFKIGNTKFSFDYYKRNELLKDINLKEVENTKYILTGYINNKTPIVMGYDNELYKYEDKKYIKIDNIFKQVGIDEGTKPIESISIKIFKKRLSVGLILSYYMGITKLMKFLKVKYKVIDRSTRYTLEKDEYSLTFKDVKVILNTNDQIGTLIMAGFNSISKDIKNIEFDLLNKKSSFPVLFNAMDMPTLYINEIKILENMFVDPITKSILNLNKDPETFVGLLIKSAELLNDNDYINPNDSSNMLIKGYERVAGMIYTEMINSIRDFENKNNFSKSKMVMDPFAIWKTINSDSTTMLTDDLNPIASLKQYEDLSYMGSGGCE